MIFIEHLRCPFTYNSLILINKSEFIKYSIPGELDNFGELTSGLIDNSLQYFYPIFNDIILLHKQYAIFIGKNGLQKKDDLSFDKKRVFDYYNNVNFNIQDSFSVYADSAKWVDYRKVSEEYMRNSFTKAGRYLPAKGKYLLDIASGTIGFPEYINLSNGYEYRICVDISVNALIGAKYNLEKAGKKGIYICGDITNIPIQDNICDAVLSQHTLYHIPKNEQALAVNEMYRVAKPISKIVIIYCWFYHSWMMNIFLNIVQIYRITRHYISKIMVRLIKSRQSLYFYAHSPRWFKNTFSFGDKIEFFAWRSTNKYFMDLYIHEKLGGEKILKKLSAFEDKYSKFMSTFGEYAAIVITKE